MVKKAWLYTFCLFLLTVLLSVSCTGINSSNSEDSSNSQISTPSAVTIANADRNNELRDRIEQISHAAQGRVGMTATVLETGESVSLNGDRRFPMQSVYKFPIAMAVLAQVIKGLLPKGTVVAHKTGTSATVNGVTAAIQWDYMRKTTQLLNKAIIPMVASTSPQLLVSNGATQTKTLSAITSVSGCIIRWPATSQHDLVVSFLPGKQ